MYLIMLNLDTYVLNGYINYFLCIRKSKPLLWRQILSTCRLNDDVLSLLRTIAAFEMTPHIVVSFYPDSRSSTRITKIAEGLVAREYTHIGYVDAR
jgi:hypothetical protein